MIFDFWALFVSKNQFFKIFPEFCIAKC